MEALIFPAMHLNPQLSRPSFLNRSSDGVIGKLNLVISGKIGPPANSLLCSYGPTSRQRSTTSRHVAREDSGGSLSGESILLNEQTLERELQVAIDQENYTQAAKIRDSLKILQEDSKTSVLAANARFYNSFRKGDLAALQAIWSKGPHACVVHPGVSGISGYDLVMGSWEFVWADYEFPLEIEIKDVEVHVKGDMGFVTCIEMVRTKGSGWGRHFATNIFERVDDRWLICVHHASYVDL
ncbi:Nuclear transport factor 2 (NTF2) family protein [Striga hermonthica]|uniref:Nuclear transport factor 2 (NTF2) family protein n=1 Tax=Striga hermonthica TaxID=68872 RepID=A0A9N7NAR8_STRHE|nr:Nuclear transport factor 2 (NTF2) family protein [Striga hermonthica]